MKILQTTFYEQQNYVQSKQSPVSISEKTSFRKIS